VNHSCAEKRFGRDEVSSSSNSKSKGRNLKPVYEITASVEILDREELRFCGEHRSCDLVWTNHSKAELKLSKWYLQSCASSTNLRYLIILTKAIHSVMLF